MGMGRLAVKHHSVLVVNKGSLGQYNEKSIEMQYILKSTKRWFWLRRKHLHVCIHEHSQPLVTPRLEQGSPCRVCSQGSSERPAQALCFRPWKSPAVFFTLLMLIPVEQIFVCHTHITMYEANMVIWAKLGSWLGYSMLYSSCGERRAFLAFSEV